MRGRSLIPLYCLLFPGIAFGELNVEEDDQPEIGDIINIVIEGEENDDASNTDLSGIYEVSQATLNVKDCEKVGEPTVYASKYLLLRKQAPGYRIAVCNGESLDEISCASGYQATHMNESIAEGWQGFRFSYRRSRAADGSPLCQLYSSRRKVIPMGAGFIQYERSDWTETLSDFIAECDRAMAKVYHESQSLKCSTHIVLFSRRVAGADTLP